MRIRPSVLIPGVVSAGSNIIFNVVSNLISGAPIPILTLVVTTLGIFLVVAFIFHLLKPDYVSPELYATRTIHSKEDRERYARRGLIVFVSLYNPIKIKVVDQLTVTQRIQAAKSSDYARLDFLKSNLEITITAIKTHASKLEHCWLVATKNGENSSSFTYIPALVKYLEKVEGIQCKFHYSEALTVSQDDDAEIAQKTIDIMKIINKDAEKLKLKPKEMITDFSGGPRITSFGLILSSLGKDSDVQYVGTHYDDEARPKGDLFPIIFEFKPEIKNG